MSSGSSSGYGSAATTVDSETATTSVPITTQVINACTPVCSQPYYPSTSSNQYGSSNLTQQQATPDDPNHSQADAELLPSINDFQFPGAMNGMWPTPINADLWTAASMQASHQLSRSPVNYEHYCGGV
ncbi:unnamed protein product [Gongylonema pulchrum]|uniref:Uncharacterized protein n=1 Tax=Gongylonema pulchrum TaxID=637853 RepID=A0A183DFN0_9BILA|nr:unnamed protein product [Gongylonema pulchrum]